MKTFQFFPGFSVFVRLKGRMIQEGTCLLLHRFGELVDAVVVIVENGIAAQKFFVECVEIGQQILKAGPHRSARGKVVLQNRVSDQKKEDAEHRRGDGEYQTFPRMTSHGIRLFMVEGGSPVSVLRKATRASSFSSESSDPKL